MCLRWPAARVYPAELPADQADDQPRYAVVVVPLGGSGPASDVRRLMPKIDVTCYGATPKQAQDVVAGGGGGAAGSAAGRVCGVSAA